jgi:hypothetical protein
MTDLYPIYRPNYGKNDCDFIHLEGEFEFRADLPGTEVYEMLRERAEMIGGLVTKDAEGEVRVYPWNGPGSFRLHFPAGDEPVDQIDVLDRDGNTVEKFSIEQMIERGKAAQVGVDFLEKHMKPAEESESEPNWVDGEPEKRYRIDFASGDLVPIDEEDDDE